MISASVIFCGSEYDEHGMPVPFNRYLVISSSWNQPDSGIASALPITAIAPSGPNHLNCIALQGGEDAAYQDILKKLKDLPENQGLSFFEEKR